MRALDAIVEILKREGTDTLFCYPTTPIIEAAAAAGIRPIVCRQERVGINMADGYTRIANGTRNGVFAFQYGPGAENAFSGVATSFADSSPVLFLPLGYPKTRSGIVPHFSSVRSYETVTKWVEQVNDAARVPEIMRRAFSYLRMGRPGPVMLELPKDVIEEELDDGDFVYESVKPARFGGDPGDVDAAAKALLTAKNPIIHAGQGVLYADATTELVELAELLQLPVMTTLSGKGGFPEDHPLSLGTGGATLTGPVLHYLKQSDLVFGIGCSLSIHDMSVNIPGRKTIIHATLDPIDINKCYPVQYPVIGDAKLVLGQFIEAAKDLLGKKSRRNDIAANIKKVNDDWMADWMPKLTSDETPINPYRVIWDFMHAIDPRDTIVTHDSGSPRDQISPFYKAVSPRSYIGWCKSHTLGTGLGLIMGAKLAAPNKMAVNFMGDAAIGMVGLDFETAVRCDIPIVTVVLNNSTMAIERNTLVISHEKFRTRDVGGNYSDMARALGGHAERIKDPAEIAAAFGRAKQYTEQEGKPMLLEFITSDEHEFSYRRFL